MTTLTNTATYLGAVLFTLFKLLVLLTGAVIVAKIVADVLFYIAAFLFSLGFAGASVLWSIFA